MIDFSADARQIRYFMSVGKPEQIRVVDSTTSTVENTNKTFPKLDVFLDFIKSVADGSLSAVQIKVYTQKLSQLNISTRSKAYLLKLMSKPEEKLRKLIIL
ncbi:MAG: hypothetical protein OHK0017_00420 [Patescibacteria group bacterium]